MKATEFKNIIYDKDDETGIVMVSINRPEIKNALSILVLIDLHRAAQLFDSDDSALAMIITGANAAENHDPTREAFSSGGYFNPAELESLDEKTKAEFDLTDIAQKNCASNCGKSTNPLLRPSTVWPSAADSRCLWPAPT